MDDSECKHPRESTAVLHALARRFKDLQSLGKSIITRALAQWSKALTSHVRTLTYECLGLDLSRGQVFEYLEGLGYVGDGGGGVGVHIRCEQKVLSRRYKNTSGVQDQ